MKASFILLAGCVTSLSCAVARADITSIYLWNAGPIDCTYSWTPSGTGASASIVGTQMGVPAGVQGTITTSGGADPTITIGTSLNNATAYAWAAEIVTVSMSIPFTISGQMVSIPPDWSAAITQTPVLVGSMYTGEITLSPGAAPIDIGQTLSFAYSVTFGDTTSFSFSQELNPIPVPEPGALGLLAGGGFLLALARRRR